MSRPWGKFCHQMYSFENHDGEHSEGKSSGHTDSFRGAEKR